MLIFEDGEEAVIQNILSMVGAKARVYDAFTFVHPLLIVTFETFERTKYNM